MHGGDRRFLAHILPDGFHKIRYYGWMSAANRKPVLAAIRKALGVESNTFYPQCRSFCACLPRPAWYTRGTEDET